MRVYFFILISLIYLQNNAQNWGDISGNTELNIQTFQEDSTINAEARDAYVRNYINLIYNYKNISVGSRWELYNNTIPGLKDYEGAGLANKFVQFKNNFIDITLGNFYDEFGNGLIFRTYYDPNLGVDNSVNGLRLKTNPYQGIYLTAIIGRQKSYWELSNSTLRALNADLLLNEIILKSWSSYVNVGASFVTKKEYDDNPLYILPENVGAFNGRLHVTKNNININIDYAYKINDPSADTIIFIKTGML